MNRLILIALLAITAAAVGTVVLENWPLPGGVQMTAMEGDAKRGAYLARLSGCVTCHTSPGAPPMSGGAAIASNFGSFHAPNITPDLETGIGGWTFDQFVRAVRQGVSPEGEAYYPAFPYEFYATLTEQDMADLWAAVQATPAVDRPSEGHSLGFPFNVRAGVRVWRSLFERSVEYVPDNSRTSEWNRGRYLVWGPAHCAACHAPRNLLGGLTSSELSGDPSMQGGGVSPPITAGALMERGYTLENLVQSLRTGVAPDGDVFGGSMAEVVHGSTNYLLEQHLVDMASYLLDLGKK
mgnify:CR=1 FL=1